MSGYISIPKDPKNVKYYKDAPAPAWGTNLRDGKTIVWVRCPECGTTADLDHEINADGRVNPSIWHQCGTSGANESGQDWHVFGILQGELTDLQTSKPGNQDNGTSEATPGSTKGAV